ncbi:type IV conjugative transfer system pilin TraA (plasmid) [Klebsiella aerogenes]|uniref:type IV conjugative transfer system pilin TraA n=1 Tax=Klebsiella aerogenes TaxID=548 RepID=UPI00244BD817|nr:type IV conjugative transfer system pilin TraA [Klebsiella aerogenes]MDH1612278.1 type IV conjugative transfer system pilin TraA [Klebsiella aerogenes]MEB5742832.1 type IV conjugative transfer system pilin TraA [Klebsiella aerogenes]WPS10990.1 type IV conjugative transfer system pilin TraA [Klebsiella aerogenes]HBR6860539.1 type IV conjugative transfer system pilin TraA [Klebsiella aerogenes]HBV9912326.1 type IV conjugative transfer system pilin TraA [Klebsiella aerogenes]
MTTALSIQSAEMSKGVKPSLRTRFFSKTKMLKAAKAVLPVAVLAAAFPEVAMATTTGTDLMKSGDGTVKATFGKGSSVVKWVILAEVIVGGIMYMMTKNVKFLAGFAILSVFVTVGMSVAGY